MATQSKHIPQTVTDAVEAHRAKYLLDVIVEQVIGTVAMDDFTFGGDNGPTIVEACFGVIAGYVDRNSPPLVEQTFSFPYEDGRMKVVVGFDVTA